MQIINQIIVRMQLFFYRIKFKNQIKSASLSELLECFRVVNKQHQDLLWEQFFKKMNHIGNLMVIVYDHSYPEYIRRKAGTAVASIVKCPFGDKYLPEAIWTDIHAGRSAYLMCVALEMPKLRGLCDFVADTHLYSFEKHSYQQVFQ